MKLPFVKYQSTGNDFILIDLRSPKLREQFSHLTRAQIARICDRRFGIGGDGLILLLDHPEYDFEMKNYNSDGGECSMCGNGGRALVKFAHSLGLKPKSNSQSFHFWASDGLHEARIEKDLVHLKMQNVSAGTPTPVGLRFETGSPHLVCAVQDLMNFDVVREGRKIRNSPLFAPTGINVNFIEQVNGRLFIRTFERGVEDETFSCGTGVIAAALAFDQNMIQTRGGELQVSFEKDGINFKNIWLIGPTEKTFEGVKTWNN